MRNTIFLAFILLTSLHCKPDLPTPYVIVEQGRERGKWTVTGRHFRSVEDFETCLEKRLLVPAKDREVKQINDTTMSAAALQNLEIWPGLGVFELRDDELIKRRKQG